LCACKEYDTKIDVWSVGCILAELHGREPLFPGDDYISQLELIFSILGSPSEEDLKFITNPRAVSWIQRLKKSFPKVPFSRVYTGVNPLAIDLMEKMLVFNPKKRISVDAALQHPYLAAMRDVSMEKTCGKNFNFEQDNEHGMSKSKLRSLLWEEIRGFHKGLKSWWGKVEADPPSTKACSSSSSSSTMSGAAPPTTITSNLGSSSSTSSSSSSSISSTSGSVKREPLKLKP